MCSIGAQAALAGGGGEGAEAGRCCRSPSSSSSSSSSSPPSSSKSARCEPRRPAASGVATPSTKPPPLHLVADLTVAILRSRIQEVRVRVTERVARSEEAKTASRRSGKRAATEMPPRRRRSVADGGRRIIISAWLHVPLLAALSPPPGFDDERLRSERCSLSDPNEISTC